MSNELMVQLIPKPDYEEKNKIRIDFCGSENQSMTERPVLLNNYMLLIWFLFLFFLLLLLYE